MTRKRPSFGSIVLYCGGLGLVAGGVGGALFGVLVVLSPDQSYKVYFDSFLVSIATACGGTVGLFLGFVLGLLNGSMLALVVEEAACRYTELRLFRRAIGVRCLGVSLVGSALTYPLWFGRFGSGFVVNIIVAMAFLTIAAVAWCVSQWFCRWYLAQVEDV